MITALQESTIRSRDRRDSSSPPVFPFRWASGWGEDKYGLWMAMTCRGACYVFRWMPPGEFGMGSPEEEKGRLEDETRHHVTLTRGFWLGETTVTQELWEAVTGNNPSGFQGHNLPVENISFDDVHTFLQQVNRLHPVLCVRLPWEAEWEYACRAGTGTAFFYGDKPDLTIMNYRGIWDFTKSEDFEKWGEDALQKTAVVKSYPCNPWGLFEMHGNVWEWCEDIWREDLGKDPAIDPFFSSDEAGAPRVVRGGSWSFNGRNVRSAIRGRLEPDGRFDFLGFRLALGHAEQDQVGGAV